FRSNCTAAQTLPHQGGGPVSALLFVLPPPRWGRVGVGVMRAECVDSVENRSSSLSDWSLADRGMERRFALREPATGCCTGWRRGQRFWHERGIPLWLKGKRHMRSYRVVRAKIR